MTTRVRTIAALTAAAVLAAAGAQDVRAEPIEQELRFLIDAHPKIRQSEKTLESRRASISEAQALYFPRVNLTGQYGPERVNNLTTRNGDGMWKGVRRTAGVNITQSLFDGFQTTSQVQGARINREIASISLEGTRQLTLFEGIQAYVDVLRQRRLVEMARENERTIQRQLNLEDERVRRGSGVTVDVLQAKSRLQIAKERRVGYEGALANSISRYQQVFEHAPNLTTMIDPAPPAMVIPSTVDRAIDIALMESPALLSEAATVEFTREKRRLAASTLYPTLDVVGAANYEREKNGTDAMRKDYSVLLTANWELFSGGSTLARQEASGFDYHASMDAYEHTTTRVIEQVKVAWQNLVTSRERKELLGNAVNIASEVFDSRKKLRDAGKETVINVLDAENEVNNAQINYTTASYDERLAVYQLLLAMGRLNPEYIVSSR